MSATDVYLELARIVPSSLQVKVTDLDITDKTLRLAGETPNYESIDDLVDSLAKGRCFAEIVKGPARQIAQAIGFQISVELDCLPKELRSARQKKKGKR